MKNSSYFYIDSFYKNAKELRKYFDECFADSRKTNPERFVWDFWNVSSDQSVQYNHLRTPAYHFFPKKMYEQFHTSLVKWGMENLGCHAISPPWLSCYVDGSEQKLHADIPHGPWAFVFSLCPANFLFSGGQTVLLKESILNYWNDFSAGAFVEQEAIFDSIDPKFNRLTVFDPRIPHGVQRVSGLAGPLNNVVNGRLVIHGWFTEPKPRIVGSLSFKALEGLVGCVQENISSLVTDSIQGILTLQFKVLNSGKISDKKILFNRLKAADVNQPPLIVKTVLSVLDEFQFYKQKKSSTITLPLVFEVSNS